MDLHDDKRDELYSRALQFSHLPDALAAEEGIRRVWAESERDSRITRLLVAVLWDGGRQQAAEELLQEGLATDPGSTDLLNVSARMLMDKSEYAAAASVAERVLAARAEDAEARIILGQSLIARNRSADAMLVLDPHAFGEPLPKVAQRLYWLAWSRKNGLLIGGVIAVAGAAAGILLLADRPAFGALLMSALGIPLTVLTVRIFGPKGLLRALLWYALVAGYYGMSILRA